VKGTTRNGGLANLEKAIEEKYLRFCDQDHPLHYMTIWAARGFVARTLPSCALCEALGIVCTVPQTDEQRDRALNYALRMLERDTQLYASPLTIPFRWRIDWYLSGLAYSHVLNSLQAQIRYNHAGSRRAPAYSATAHVA